MTVVTQSAASATPGLTPELLFGDHILAWGKHSGKPLLEIWNAEPDYLRWAANLLSNKCTHPPAAVEVAMIKIAHMISRNEIAAAEDLYREFSTWRDLSDSGIGLEDLPRPSREECKKTIAACTLLGGHADLDGMYSLAIAIARGGALEGGKMKGAFGRLRLFRYSFKNIDEYTQALGGTDEDCVVVIDYAAHPRADLNLDHHTTSLSYWELAAPLPKGIYEPSMPSCPRLLATYCGLEIREDILSGCDMIDGAIYPELSQAYDLSNPFVALDLALSLDVSDTVAKKVVLTLAENDLDPGSVLHTPVWKARIELIKLELEEQRSYWSRPNRTREAGEFIAIADSRLAPYSATRFRYIPFENETVISKPYLITIRPSGGNRVNLSIARNPFYSRPEFFTQNPINLGGLARTLGKGGGRQEIGSTTFELPHLSAALLTTQAAVEASVKEERVS